MVGGMARTKHGDIVRVDHKGRVFLAFVKDITQNRKGSSVMLKIEPITKGITWYEVPQREVKRTWRALAG